MDLIVTKWIGMEAAVMLAHDRKEELLQRFPAAFVHAAAGMQRSISIPEDARAVSRFQPDGVCLLGEGGFLLLSGILRNRWSPDWKWI